MSKTISDLYGSFTKAVFIGLGASLNFTSVILDATKNGAKLGIDFAAGMSSSAVGLAQQAASLAASVANSTKIV
jgi:hypothetical protein